MTHLNGLDSDERTNVVASLGRKRGAAVTIVLSAGAMGKVTVTATCLGRSRWVVVSTIDGIEADRREMSSCDLFLTNVCL